MKRCYFSSKTGKYVTDSGNEAYFRRGNRHIATCMRVEEQRLVQLRALELAHGGKARADVLERAMDCLEYVLGRMKSLEAVPSTLDRYKVEVEPRRRNGARGSIGPRKRAMLIRWSRPRYRQLCVLKVQLGEREGKTGVSRRVLLGRALDAMEWVVEHGTPLAKVPSCAEKYAALVAANDNDPDYDWSGDESARA